MKQLPRLMLVTQRSRMRPNFETALEAALRGGAQLIQLREKALPIEELLALAHGAKKLCDSHGATLIINSAPEIAQTLNAGLHLAEGAPIPRNFNPCGASAHSLQSAQRAAEQGAQYLVFGSIFPTQSHPGALPTGLEILREVCAAVEVPVFAIGGITSINVKSCLQAGVHGIAVIGAAWDTEDVEAAVQELKLATDARR